MTKTNKSLWRRIGSIVLSAFLLSGIAIASNTTAEAQRRGRGRVVIVRPIRPFGPFGYRRWYGNPYGYPYGYYSQYVFSNSERAENQGYNDGQKTGRDDGKKAKSYDPERSHYFQEAGYGNFAEAYRGGFDRGYHDGYYSQRVG